jgi:hypothetical protein
MKYIDTDNVSLRLNNEGDLEFHPLHPKGFCVYEPFILIYSFSDLQEEIAENGYYCFAEHINDIMIGE